MKLLAAKEKLEIVNVRDGVALNFAHPHPSRAKRGEERIPFEQFQEYTAIDFLALILDFG